MKMKLPSINVKSHCALQDVHIIALGILFIFALFGSALVQAELTFANNPESSSASKSESLNNFFTDESAQQEFLAVTDAYQLAVSLDDSTLILNWHIEEGYYLYQERFDLTAKPEVLPPLNSNTLTFSASKTKYDDYFEKDMAVFYKEAILTLDISHAEQAFILKIESQGCADAGLCYPPYSEYHTIDPITGTISPSDIDAFLGSSATSADLPEDNFGIISVILFAILGGLILNLMPCVFPVLSIKILSLAQADSKRLPQHGWVYTLGVTLSFFAFGALLMFAKSSGEAIGWGFQLQSPALIAVLVYLFLLLGLNLSGLLNINGSWAGAGQKLTQKSGLSGSFFTGVLAAVVASPCTAPFMGVAMGYALTQPMSIGLFVFVALGFGMALPLLILCHLPSLTQYLPKPGVWMDTLKQALAFPLYLTALWLLWVLGHQAGSDAIAIILLGILSAAFALWLWHLTCHHIVSKTLKTGLLLASLILTLILPFTFKGNEVVQTRWEPYTHETLSTLRHEGRSVFINLTADWCITCLANERITLGTDEINQAFDQYNIATLKGDWTDRNPEITQLLEQYKRSGVPLYLWFPANSSGPGQMLPQLLRKKHLLDIFKEM